MIGGPGEAAGTASVSVPLARSVYCAIQNREDDKIRIRCLLPGAWGGPRQWEGTIDTLYTKKGPPRSLAVLRSTFSDEEDEWMMRVIASILGLRRTRQLNTPKHGFDMLIWSRLPETKGYGWEAAFGVATSLALKGATGLAKKRVDGVQVARAVVHGASEVLGEDIPMTDALTSTLGRRDCALFIEHGVDLKMQWVPIPQQCCLAAVDLGVKERVDEDIRNAATIGPPMAMAYLNQALRKEKKPEFGSWGQVPPTDFEGGMRDYVPASVSGSDWLKIFRRLKDTQELAKKVDSERSYRLRAAAEHQCRESSRARRFVSNLTEYGRTLREGFLVEAGRCINSSHRSLQEKCKIILPPVNEFLDLLRSAGRKEGMFGARLTEAGGSSVAAALIHSNSRQPIRDMVEDFCKQRKLRGNVITENEDGGGLLGWWEGVLEPSEDTEMEAAAEAKSGAPEKAAK